MNELLNISKEQFQAILFDFDGVLAESLNVKTQAFAKLFEKFGEDIVQKVVDYHLKNSGVSRYKKIKYYYSEYIHEPLSDDDLNMLSKQFSNLAVEDVINAPWVRGAKEFLERYYKTMDLYVVSSTPHQEIQLIVKSRNMERYFKGVFGSPETKGSNARRIISERRYAHEKVLFIGDSIIDYQGAKEAHIKFLGRVPKGTKSNFPDHVPVISDFLDWC